MKGHNINSISLVVLFAISLLLISCKKKYHVVGRAYNPITGQGIANQQIDFLRTTTEFPGGNAIVTSTWTDANGNYEIEYKGRAERVRLSDYGTYYLLGSLENSEYKQALRLEHKTTQQIDWHMLPYGELILNIQNVNCEGSSDTMVFRAKGQFDADYQSWWSSVRVGCYSYTSPPPYTNFPMGYRYYEMKVTRPSGITFVYDTVFIPETGVAQIDLFY